MTIFNVSGSYDKWGTVGTAVTLSHNTYGNLQFEVVGKDIDGVGATTLICKSIVACMAWGSSGTNYNNSTIRSWLNGTFYNGFSASAKSLIKQVSKSQQTSSGGTETTQDYCWALSQEEYYNNTYTVSSYVRAYSDSYSWSWWLRSPSNNDYAYCWRGANQSLSTMKKASYDTYGVVPMIVV